MMLNKVKQAGAVLGHPREGTLNISDGFKIPFDVGWSAGRPVYMVGGIGNRVKASQ